MIKLYHDDSLKLLPQLIRAGLKVDAIITDPPYNVSVAKSRINRKSGKFVSTTDILLDFGKWDHGQITWTDYVDLFVDLLTDNGVLVMFYDKLHLGQIGLYLQDNHGFTVRHIGAIVKRNPAPQARKVKWQNGLEQFLVATKNKGTGHHFNYELGQSPDYILTTVNYKHYHPTQKSEPAMQWIVSYWTFKGDTVLDPFMGSGTTGVVCAKLSRNFIGIEVDDKYFEIARQRICSAGKQEMFNF